MRSLSLAGFVVIWLSASTVNCDEGAESDKIVVTRQSVFSIPFTVKSPPVNTPKEVQLHVSGDRGRRWSLYQRQHPATGQFHFSAGHDGEYWFAVRTIGAVGAAAAPGEHSPELRIIVDTTRPKLELMAELGPSGQIQARWIMADANIAPDSFRLEYKGATDIQWKPVSEAATTNQENANTLTGEATWWSQADSRNVEIRAAVRDRAGNVASAVRLIEVPRVAAQASPVSHGGRSATIAQRGAKGAPQPQTEAIPWPGERVSDAPVAHSNSARGWRPPSSGRIPDGDSLSSEQHARQTRQGEGRRELAAAPQEASNRPIARPIGDVRPMRSPVSPPVADRVVLPSTATTGADDPRISTSRSFQLDYEVDVNATTLSRVELWATTDGGRTWSHMADDEDRLSPIQVDVDREGTYGFRLVLHGAGGMSAHPPQPGDVADIWVHADWTRPTARLTSARYGTGDQLGKLLIGWEAADRHLSDRAVSLFYSAHRDGPWTSIATGLTNTGGYEWRIGDHLPREFFLRLEVRDRAGNLGADQLTESIRSDGLAPRGRIRSVRPVESGEEKP